MSFFTFCRNFASFRVCLVPILACLVTWACVEMEWSFSMTVEASVFFVGIFFCFGVVMNTADERRFQAFDEIALIKGNLLAIAHMAQLCAMTNAQKQTMKSQMKAFLQQVTVFLRQSPEQTDYSMVDGALCKLSQTVEVFRQAELRSPEVSRVEQFLAQIDFSFEKLAVIKEHRTPKMLRMFLYGTLGISVFVIAPEFADLGYWGVFVSGLITWLLMILITIQEKIEHPFGDDMDDIALDFVERFERRLKF